MDYKYIEQLLERYWAAETSVEEERILHAFFRQSDVPPHLARYAALFAWRSKEVEEKPTASLEQRLLHKAEEIERAEHPRVVYAQRVSKAVRLLPLLRAAAVVTVVLLVSVTAQHALHEGTQYASWEEPTAEQGHMPQTPVQTFEAGVSLTGKGETTTSTYVSPYDSLSEDSTL